MEERKTIYYIISTKDDKVISQCNSLEQAQDLIDYYTKAEAYNQGGRAETQKPSTLAQLRSNYTILDSLESLEEK